MKTVEELKSQIFQEVQSSGYLKNVSAQIKTHVLQIIDRETQGNKYKMGFQYEHPVLKKLRNYPLTSLCMDLIQEFLESFKFKHTLNVFKKQINRDLAINRNALKQEFSIDLSAKDHSVLLAIVGQIVNGDVRVIEKERPAPKQNNFVNSVSKENSAFDTTKSKMSNTSSGQQANNSAPTTKKKEKQPVKYYDIPETKPSQNHVEMKNEKQKEKEKEKEKGASQTKKQDILKQKEEEMIEKKRQEEKGKKGKKEEEKPPEGASDLLADIVSKFVEIKEKKPSNEEEFKKRKAFSEEKPIKKIVPQESGTNKIRGNISSSFMKFSSLGQISQKNQSNVIDDECQDSFQHSRDSTRKNPLYQSSQDKSFLYDQSIDDSMAIEDYEYVEKAKKFKK